MCNFIPGECVGIVSTEFLDGLGEDLPGVYRSFPLFPQEDFEGAGNAEIVRKFSDFHFLRITGIPEGLEIYVISQLSARLSDAIKGGQAVVELNYRLPLSSAEPQLRLRLSRPALQLAVGIRALFAELTDTVDPLRPVAMLDAALDQSSIDETRTVSQFDFLGEHNERWGEEASPLAERPTHGSRVFKILDSCLPKGVEIVAGRIFKNNHDDISTLRVAAAFSSLVARKDPTVVNISAALSDHYTICTECGSPVWVSPFHSQLLPFVFRLVEERTTVVMAAGNQSQIANARHASAEVQNLILVEALNSKGSKAAYSNVVDTEYAKVSAAFGGEPIQKEGSIPCFEGDPEGHGTSFAAPWVTALTYLRMSRWHKGRLPLGYYFDGLIQSNGYI